MGDWWCYSLIVRVQLSNRFIVGCSVYGNFILISVNDHVCRYFENIFYPWIFIFEIGDENICL